jgi:hypothetical protein
MSRELHDIAAAHAQGPPERECTRRIRTRQRYPRLAQKTNARPLQQEFEQRGPGRIVQQPIRPPGRVRIHDSA